MPGSPQYDVVEEERLFIVRLHRLNSLDHIPLEPQNCFNFSVAQFSHL